MGYSAPAFGILSTGFVRKLTGDVELDMQTALRATVDPNLDLSATEPMGQATSIFAAAVAEGWEILETVYNGVNPNDAEGLLLDNVSAITGTTRTGATYSRVVVTCNLGAGASIPVGTQGNVSGQPTNLWRLIGAGSSTTNFTAGPLTSTTSGNYSAVFEATQTGPQVANAGTLTVITAGSVTGLNSITNPADAILGSNEETDTHLRIKREQELAQSGSATLDAIRAAVLEVPGVIAAYVFENTSDGVDSDGRPAHSIEVVVFDGVSPAASNDVIAQTLWKNKPAGIPYYSATGDHGTATAADGTTRTVAFSRSSAVNVYLAYTVKTNSLFDVVNGPAAIKAAAAAYAEANLVLGSTVYALEFRAVPLGPLSAYAVKGVVDVTSLALDITSSPTATANLTFTARQYPYITTPNISVTVT